MSWFRLQPNCLRGTTLFDVEGAFTVVDCFPCSCWWTGCFPSCVAEEDGDDDAAEVVLVVKEEEFVAVVALQAAATYGFCGSLCCPGGISNIDPSTGVDVVIPAAVAIVYIMMQLRVNLARNLP
jgi:hypothetical protein